MLKFIRGKGLHLSDESLRHQKELYAFKKTMQHGFPNKPSALAYDPVLKLLSIGTQTGIIKVFGRPGVEFYGQYISTNENAEQTVQLLEWIYGTGYLLSLTTGNELTLWEPAYNALAPIKGLHLDGKTKKISSICSSLEQNVFWLGTEGGNVYEIDLKTFELNEPIINYELISEQIPSTYKTNPGAVECIRQLPNNPHLLLISFNRGLCILWDNEKSTTVRTYVAPGHGQSVGLYVGTKGSEFTWYHADGSYAVWKVNSTLPPDNVNFVPYGPDPCKSIDRLYKGTRGSADLVVFSGGMPRSAYGDHNCVSIYCSDGNKICLDFTSKVIDFFVTFKENSEIAEALIVLLEEELCAYDLTDAAIPPIKTPYLHSVHASAITCNYIASEVSQEVYDKIVNAGQEQDSKYSDLEWPVTGGNVENDDVNESENELETFELLLTGHEDGSVKFWDITGVTLTPICAFNTTAIFRNENEAENHTDNEVWDETEPPFRKAGNFDPYSDDPRFAIKKIVLCPKTGHCLIGGTAGQMILANFENEDINEDNKLVVNVINLVGDRDGFVWKGHSQLSVRNSLLEENEPIKIDAGVNILTVLQILPPAGITSLALESDWRILSGGTAHGLVVFDYNKLRPVFHRCTLNPNDLNGAGEQLSRRKSFKKSLRESFRKLRKGRSTRRNNAQTASTVGARPVERQIEARSAYDDSMGSMVRCLVFARTYVANGNTTSATLWSGTNAGTVSVFLLHLDRSPNVAGQLAKEIQLKHRAPVVGISIFQQNGYPVDNSAVPHRVLIASEEQFKIFSLPQLKPINKYKLTAHEGTRIRRIHFAKFYHKIPREILDTSANSGGDASTVANNTSDTKPRPEMALLSLTNLGDILVLSIPDLRRQINAEAVRREDINGISSLCFTNNAEALYFMSSSELQRLSLAASKVTIPNGTIELVSQAVNPEPDANESEKKEISTSITEKSPKVQHYRQSVQAADLSNGYHSSNNVNDSFNDITMDSVRDHLNTTINTLCSTVTDESVGHLSVTSIQTHSSHTNVNLNNLANIENVRDGDVKKNTSSTVTIKANITSIAQNEAPVKKTFCEESQL